MLRRVVATFAGAGLIAGCASAPAAAPGPTMALAPVVDLAAPSGHLAAGPVMRGFQSTSARLPRSGRWVITWRVGEHEQSDTYDLTFEPGGGVVVADSSGDRQRYPLAYEDGHLRFDGAARPNLLSPGSFDRERFDVVVVSEERLTGTRSIRVNSRWVALPTQAAYSKTAPAARS